jgi:hypothetical protein
MPRSAVLRRQSRDYFGDRARCFYAPFPCGISDDELSQLLQLHVIVGAVSWKLQQISFVIGHLDFHVREGPCIPQYTDQNFEEGKIKVVGTRSLDDVDLHGSM